ncbi:MAG TPA: response regulator [Stellaceae bacterium]|jgi:DNA-binding response OmpR family regulator
MIVTRTLGDRAVPYVLVLEDLDAIANLLRGELNALGYRCFSLRSKASAERFLKRVRPDLVIVDYGLLGGTGIKAAQMAAQSDVPVIVMSGYLDVRDEIELLGFYYVQKPFGLSEMLDLVSRLVARDPPVGDPT